jgi:hypothetical protein
MRFEKKKGIRVSMDQFQGFTHHALQGFTHQGFTHHALQGFRGREDVCIRSQSGEGEEY